MELVIELVIILIVASFMVWFFRSAPFIQPPFREWGVWGTIAIAGLIIIVRIVIPLLRSLSF